MKKFFFAYSMFFIFFAASIFAAQVEKNSDENYPSITIKEIYDFDKNILLLLEDGTLWELFSFDLRYRSLGEWWYGYKLKVEENLFWKKEDWDKNDAIFLYKNSYDPSIAENFTSSDREKYDLYPYIFSNNSSQKIAFARRLNFETFISICLEYGKNQYNKGYDKGYDSGYYWGYSLGYSSGYSQGACK